MTEPSERRSGDGATPAEPTLFADLPAVPAAASTAAAQPDPEEQQAAALSEAARGAVRQPADPRIDAHLAHLGLMDGPVPARPTRGTTPGATAEPAAAPPAPDLAPELQRLEAMIRAVESAHDATTARVRSLVWGMLAIGIVAVVAFVLAIVLR